MNITPKIIDILTKITNDNDASIEIKIDKTLGLAITMYWNQFGQRCGYRNVLSNELTHQTNIQDEIILDKMFKAIEFEVGRLNYEN